MEKICCSDIRYKKLSLLIEERCGTENFLRGMHMSGDRLARLLIGETELRQDELLKAAQLLGLCSKEFTECFFLA